MSLKMVVFDPECAMSGCVQSTHPGWQSQTGEVYIPPRAVIGIVIAQAFPDADAIREKIIEGIQRAHPDTVWVMRDAPREKHAAKVAWDTFEQFGVEPILAPLVPYWKFGAKDMRADMRDIQMRGACERIVVFHDSSSGVTKEWAEFADARREHPSSGQHCIAKVYIVERGTKKTVRRKGRKPVGA